MSFRSEHGGFRMDIRPGNPIGTYILQLVRLREDVITAKYSREKSKSSNELENVSVHA